MLSFDLPLAAWALLAFLAYGVLGILLGDVFPFSRYGLYASAPAREKGAVPVFLAEGREARIADFESFDGIETGAMYPEGYPCSLEWMVREAQAWVDDHRGAGPGPVPVAWGFRVLQVGEDGTVTENLEVLCEGTARRRGRA